MSGSTSVGNKRVEEGEPNKKRVNVKRPFSENDDIQTEREDK